MPAINGIGVISSIGCPQPLMDAFENAYNRVTGNDPNVIFFDHVGYDPARLTEAVVSLTADATVDLFVTFGGRMVYDAVDAARTKPFISLLGEVPANPDTGGGGKCFGGVSTDSFARNQPRALPVTFTAGSRDVREPTNSFAVGDKVGFTPGKGAPAINLPTNVNLNQTYLVSTVNAGATTFQFTDTAGNAVTPGTTGTPPLFAWGSNWANRVSAFNNAPVKKSSKDITLLYHPGSPLVKREIAFWTGGAPEGAWPRLDPVFDKGPAQAVPFREKRGFADAFERITTDCVIISADPYFQEHKEELIQAANDSLKIICYPYAEYRNRNGTNKPRSGFSYLYGPNLRDAVAKMGELAGNYATLANPPRAFIPVTVGYGDKLRPFK